MGLEKQPFRKYNLEENPQDTINVYLNPKRRELLEQGKAILRQPKDSTALWTLAEIGLTKMLNDPSLRLILDRFEAFQRRNKRTGVVVEFPKTNISERDFKENMPETEPDP